MIDNIFYRYDLDLKNIFETALRIINRHTFNIYLIVNYLVLIYISWQMQSACTFHLILNLNFLQF